MLVLGVDQLIEIALCAARRLLLVDELEAVLIELFEEIIPGDLLQVFVFVALGLRKRESENSGLLALVGGSNLGGHRTALFRPVANRIVVLRGLGQCHMSTSGETSAPLRWIYRAGSQVVCL